MYNLTIAAVFKDEEKWLREWLVYHLIVGVDHFILFNNGKSQPSFNIIEPFITCSAVTYYDFDHPYGDLQIAAYDLALQYFRNETKWLAYIDLDELVYPINNDHIYHVLQHFETEDIIGLNIPVATFGTSNLDYSPLLQSEAFVHRAVDKHPSNYTSKQFLRPHFHKQYQYGGNVNNPGMVDPDKKQSFYNKQFRSSLFLRINHYGTRSLEDWNKKVKRGWPIGRPGGDINKTMWDKKFKMLNQNEVFDDSIYRFLPEIKSRLCMLS